MSDKQSNCPRCQKPFICLKENIGACACSGLSISNATKSFLSKTFYGCLCNDCLLEFDRLIGMEKEHPFPGLGGTLIEGIHYYMEGEYRVFTTFYHVSRGYCCRSGCRHCAYGFKKRYAE